MSTFPALLFLLLAAVVVGSAATLLVQRVLVREQPPPTRIPAEPQMSPTPPHVREFEGEPFPEPVQDLWATDSDDGVSKEPWNPHRRPPDERSQAATYRAARGSSMRPGEQWNPFAEEQSRASRIKAPRRRPRTVSRTPDYYSLLGLERGASDAQIEQAYRRHAALIHPDHFYDNPVRRKEAEAKLKQLNAAMQVLRDPLRRARYDANLL